jgi:predicted ATPase
MEVLNRNNAQFIISTHSPILMGIPNANLYQILDDSMEAVKYRETEHYSITKNFLDNPDFYLRYL